MIIENNVISCEIFGKYKEKQAKTKVEQKREKDPSWLACETYLNSMKGPEINPLMCVLAKRQYNNEKEMSPITYGKPMSPEYIAEVEEVERERGFI